LPIALLTLEDVMADPELQCSGLLVVFEPGVALCDLGDDCEALAYRADFEMYRAAHQRKVSADAVMDPEGEY
jgi:hypothetical protein